MLAGEDMQRKYMLPFRSIEKIGLKTYRYFIAPTEVAIAQLTSLRQRPQTYMIPNGVAQPKPVMKAAPERYILYIGRIEVNQKGLDLLVAAYASLGLSSDVKLIIAGTGVAQEEKKLRGLIRASNLADRIKLVGRVEGRRKWRLIQQSCLVVIPSRLETFGIVALEAMASSKPVACFDIPGLAWMPTSFAVKAQPFNSRALGESMQRILSDEELASRMAASAQQASLRYSWDKITEQYLDVIEHILQTEGAPTKELANEN
jgi:glycosyltransferase involved in cell wall biosynthesis